MAFKNISTVKIRKSVRNQKIEKYPNCECLSEIYFKVDVKAFLRAFYKHFHYISFVEHFKFTQTSPISSCTWCCFGCFTAYMLKCFSARFSAGAFLLVYRWTNHKQSNKKQVVEANCVNYRLALKLSYKLLSIYQSWL